MNTFIGDIEGTILRMTQSLEAVLEDRGERLGWWVLVCGEPLDAESFELREKARERLRRKMKGLGIIPEEYIWVWDDNDRAQVVAAVFQTKEEADSYASRLRKMGLEVSVVRQRPDVEIGEGQ